MGLSRMSICHFSGKFFTYPPSSFPPSIPFFSLFGEVVSVVLEQEEEDAFSQGVIQPTGGLLVMPVLAVFSCPLSELGHVLTLNPLKI